MNLVTSTLAYSRAVRRLFISAVKCLPRTSSNTIVIMSSGQDLCLEQEVSHPDARPMSFCLDML
jgi:hypothetical protein